MEIQIAGANKQSVKNFTKWFNKEGFDLFTKSKYNKLIKHNTDSYITCLSTDEKLVNSVDGSVGHFYELE